MFSRLSRGVEVREFGTLGPGIRLSKPAVQHSRGSVVVDHHESFKKSVLSKEITFLSVELFKLIKF